MPLQIDPVAGEYMVVMSGGQGGEEMRAMADWLAAQGGRDFFTLRNMYGAILPCRMWA